MRFTCRPVLGYHTETAKIRGVGFGKKASGGEKKDREPVSFYFSILSLPLLTNSGFGDKIVQLSINLAFHARWGRERGGYGEALSLGSNRYPLI